MVCPDRLRDGRVVWGVGLPLPHWFTVKSLSSLLQVTSSLLVPVAFGLSAFLLLCAIVDGGLIQNELVDRYLFGHWVSRTTTALFCIGVAALLLVGKNLLGQFAAIRRIQLEEVDVDPSTETDASLSEKLLGQLKSLPGFVRDHYLYQRLQKLLEHISRNGASHETESELRHLADSDRDQKQGRYAFVRILIWAIPLLGFLGTVLGISEALGKLSVGAEEDLPAMMSGLQSSLYVAFDTTAQALVLSIGLMFALFLFERIEGQLLQLVDTRALEIASGFFEFTTPASEAATQVSRLGRRLLASTRSAVREQTEIWRSTIGAAEQAWASAHLTAGEETRLRVVAEIEQTFSRLCQQLESAVTQSLEQSRVQHEQLQNQSADRIERSLQILNDGLALQLNRLETATSQNLEQANRSFAEQWAAWQTGMQSQAADLAADREVAAEHTRAMNQLAQHLESIVSVQEALNRSLDALTSTSRIEVVLADLVQVLQGGRGDSGRSVLPATRRDTVPSDPPVTIRFWEGAKRAA